MTLIDPHLSAQALFTTALDLQKQQKHIEAVSYFNAALEKAPEHFAQINAQRFVSVWSGFKQAQDLSAWDQYDALQRLVVMGLTQGQWFVGEATLAAPLLTNFSLLAFTRKHAALVLDSLKNQPQPDFKHQLPAPNKKIKLGFVGADFFSQATAYLLTAAIACIDREAFEVYAYDHGEHIKDGDEYRERAEAAYDVIVPICDMDDVEAAQRIYDDGIDVLFSIKNPASARLAVFALRPAPIQIHYLYFPGTSGMPFFDYIIGDHVVTPPDLDSGYAEKVLRMEGCYQPNDDQRQLPMESSRDYWDLPEDAVVLANMSQNYKITPQMFEVWCRLLHNDHRRILWLLSGGEEVERHLRREAERRGIDPARLFFSPPMGIRAHHTRLRCADVVVDTFPYGGHTLTSDALWAGTPVVTLAGTTFASRVAASLLTSVGLANLVAWHEDEYFSKADQLARDAAQRQAIRKHLDDNRYAFDLFSPRSYARRFEKLIKETVAHHEVPNG